MDTFRLGYVPGATPAKWARIWQERHPRVRLELVPVAAADAASALVDGALEAALLRLPVDAEALHAIPLYAEVPVVVASRDHLLAALEGDEDLPLEDLDDELVLHPRDDVLPWAGEPGASEDAPSRPGMPARERPETTADAVALVAAGVGVVIVPMSLARLHHRKDVVTRPLLDGPLAPVALAWRRDAEDERIEDLVGIVRGRTVNSSRGRRDEPAAPPPAKKKAAPQPTKKKQSPAADRRQAAQRRAQQTGKPQGAGKAARKRRGR